ncbi:hypothetical protein SAMN05216480_12351 [Pustulibacterium marinum]|uniref:Uncharacterized protein n=1 Tax=Pustulibacterium marinum TaxID=1224947 RepID=A0A1I7IX20_9FLAO|nr:hypothetical protein [Pustulibacterium marinum]SFU77381.1 hypothetical protein SAMN05216480_12351 [Pustulibacterium marinum]
MSTQDKKTALLLESDLSEKNLQDIYRLFDEASVAVNNIEYILLKANNHKDLRDAFISATDLNHATIWCALYSLSKAAKEALEQKRKQNLASETSKTPKP